MDGDAEAPRAWKFPFIMKFYIFSLSKKNSLSQRIIKFRRSREKKIDEPYFEAEMKMNKWFINWKWDSKKKKTNSHDMKKKKIKRENQVLA